MLSHKTRIRIFLFAVLSILVSPVIAGDEELHVKTQNGVSYISGGVGDEEQALIEEKSGNFPLQITFADTQGKFLSGVKVEIRDSSGTTVLSTTADGPMLNVDLEAGQYTVQASPADFPGEPQSRDVDVSSKPVKLNLIW